MRKTLDHSALEKRRQKAGRLFEKEIAAPEVARRLGVSRQVVYRWKEAWKTGGKMALLSKGSAGPKVKLTVEQTQQITQALLLGPLAQGYKSNYWTLPRIAVLIENLTGVRYHPVSVGRLLRANGFSSGRTGTGRWNMTRKPSASGGAWCLPLKKVV